MADTPFTVERFGGLNTRDDPFEIGASAATAMSNVDFDHRGTVRTRDGLTRNANTTLLADGTSGAGAMAYYEYSGQPYIVARAANYTDVVPVNLLGGANGDTIAAQPLTNNSMTRFGAPGTTRLYVTDATQIHRLNDTTWTTFACPAGPARADFLAVTSNDNRLIVAGGETLAFSQPNDPETFDPTDTITLSPGDGEEIGAVITWQNLTFVFKQTKFFVFTGTSLDSDGGAIFNYRTVEAGLGVVDKFDKAVAGREGVFFASTEGVFVTTGGTPVCVSGVLEPWPNDGGPLGYYRQRLYSMAVTQRIFDTRQDLWLQWDLAASGVCAVPAGNYAGLYTVSTASKRLCAISGETDEDTAIAWSYTSGRYSLADPGDAVITRESSVVGSGAVKLGITTDLYGALYGTTAATLGTAPATAEGWPAGDQEGTWFQHTLSGTGPATVSRLTHYVSSQKAASIR